MSSSDKLKLKTLTLSAKVEIIETLDKGEKFINLAKEYDVDLPWFKVFSHLIFSFTDPKAIILTLNTSI
jgi:hypothetical protein